MCRDDEDAADVLQETLLAAARTLPDFRGASSVSTCLYTIARSYCIKKRRTSKFAPAALESLDQQADQGDDVADPDRSPEEAAAGRQLQAALDTAIGSLEPMYREVLVLRDVKGLPAADVAETLGISVDAVKSRLHRARMAVRERVAPVLGLGADGTPAPGCRRR
jgi:RNA polymerase sigma-70 factor (ECF subfamily)